MNKSLFIQLVDKYLAPVVRAFTEKINGKKEEETLLYKTMLDEEYAPDLKWESTELQGTIVAADIVSLDSRLPLKKRDAIQKALGKLPKLGFKFRKDETDIVQLNTMMATGATETTIAQRLLNDVPRSISGVQHRIEMLFEEGLSTGLILVEDEDTPGLGVRANFGYNPDHVYHCTAGAWGSGTEEPIDDIQQLFDGAAANGEGIALVMLSESYFNLMRKSPKGKLLVATNNGQTVADINTLGKPTRSAMIEALTAEFGATFRTVNNSFKVEAKDGSRKVVRPWEQANVVALTSEKVGRLVYGRLAEETNPVAGVSYEKSGNYILVSKYSKNEPLEEFTSAQAFVLPVIDGGNSVYILHADAAGVAELTATPKEVAFGKAAGKATVDIHYDGDSKLSASSAEAWATVKVVRDKVEVAVTANDGEARSSVVTVTDGNVSTTFTVSQSNI